MADEKQKRDNVVVFRVSDGGLLKIDQMRNTWSRSEYIRRALAMAVKGGLRGPTVPDDL